MFVNNFFKYCYMKESLSAALYQSLLRDSPVSPHPSPAAINCSGRSSVRPVNCIDAHL